MEPLGTTGFIATLFVHVAISDALRSGLNLPHPRFGLADHRARRRDIRYGKGASAGFGSILSFWDIVPGFNGRC